MIRLRPALAGGVAWLVGAATAVSVGLLALSLVGVGPTEEPLQPMSPEAVELEASAAPMPATSAAPTSAPPVRSTPTVEVGTAAKPSPSGTERRLTSRGGAVVASCRPSGAYLVYWTPAQGYKAEDVIRGPAAAARLIFEGHEHHYRIVVTCVDSVPRASIRDTEEEHEDDD